MMADDADNTSGGFIFTFCIKKNFDIKLRFNQSQLDNHQTFDVPITAIIKKLEKHHHLILYLVLGAFKLNNGTMTKR